MYCNHGSGNGPLFLSSLLLNNKGFLRNDVQLFDCFEKDEELICYIGVINFKKCVSSSSLKNRKIVKKAVGP